ncbi:WG repeat-containing protein [Paenibacillus sp. SAF-054]|uniref:WG repeat-containing protein n=1 Tax=unclassified Paenibacillus TaxID=185978 RepID=UPI003F7E6103
MKKRVLILLSACIALCVSSFGSTATAASKRTESYHKRTIDASIVVPRSDGAFHDGLLLAMKSDGQRVYYHVNGQIAFQLPAEVTPVSDFSAQRAIVKNNITNLMGFVNTKGDLVTPLQYEEADSFSEGVAYVKCNGEKYLIDRFGRSVQRLHLDVHSTYQFKDGLATAYDATTGEVGYINKAEQVIIPLKYRAGRDFSEGLALIGRATSVM